MDTSNKELGNIITKSIIKANLVIVAISFATSMIFALTIMAFSSKKNKLDNEQK